MNSSNDLKDEELLLRLSNTEDSFVERKVFSDSGDWLKTAVAFANSAPIGDHAVLFIGVKNDGTPEERDDNLEGVMKSFGQKLARAYPKIYYLTRVLTVCGKERLAIIIPGSADRPHFAGPSYVRVGSESREASEEQFAALIASRNSKVREILNWQGKLITVEHLTPASKILTVGPVFTSELLWVVDCNQFYVTLENRDGKFTKSFPLSRVEISFDHSNNRLNLEYRPT